MFVRASSVEMQFALQVKTIISNKKIYNACIRFLLQSLNVQHQRLYKSVQVYQTFTNFYDITVI